MTFLIYPYIDFSRPLYLILGTYERLFDCSYWRWIFEIKLLKSSKSVSSSSYTKSQRHNIFVSRLKKYIHKYSWRIRSNNILHPRSLKIFYIKDICKIFHEERSLHHLRELYARILGDWL
ncbi:hypothetical protein GIB67_006805 [Kingdonia uniflora]|uniref:Maturase K n=1 Tax=Kingdonia uniflora TaxID=39325 RepID=A0A7J7KZY6_9MAGN|nr:hypothetical protein GIB67_006805 [Kingdonia uniflora]